ncbi:Endoribonuclease L-PSP/chorismate mutase-like protein [Aspergillus caelatus]|uniref:Endoribonuclease L-PSP/chorismate mutase-like protein n=1 Tax=Aspergillus caelatus TaxID=61420 RepID=A0A5N7A507_9EURO|nr:Endoribonuclease L-PSP/chorismate mutase-like protein [Aspergillus caelatus]KAE8364269.1 Endoribonuclease L-PSP/chorismate mutase-like protein [Aspergillus caelatus]
MPGKVAVLTPSAPAPMPVLSQGVICNGMVYVLGSLAIDPSTGRSVEGTVADRTDQIFRNISAILQAAGSSLANIVKVNIFLTDMSNFQTMNEAYAKNIPEGAKPVRTCVAVRELPFGSNVEIECTAALEDA